MSLPPRVSEKRTPAKRPKRETRWRSDAHRNDVRRYACANCGERAGIEVAHYRLGSHTGMGQKPDDWLVTPLCKSCHDRQHAIGEDTFWQEYRVRTGQSVEQLIDALCQASPKAAEIRRAKLERLA